MVEASVYLEFTSLNQSILVLSKAFISNQFYSPQTKFIMSQNLKKPHYYKSLTPVKTIIDNQEHTGLIIGRLHKLPIKGKKEEPYYIVTGIGPAIWENHLTPITEEEYQLSKKEA